MVLEPLRGQQALAAGQADPLALTVITILVLVIMSSGRSRKGGTMMGITLMR